MIFFIVILILIFVTLDIYALYVLLFLIGCVATSQFLSFPAAISMVDKKVGGTLTGVVNTITMLGCTIVAPLVGWSIDFFGTDGAYSATDYRNGMMILLVSVAIAIISTLFIKNKRISSH